MLNDFVKTILYLSVSGSLIAIILLMLKPIQNKVSKKWYYYVWIIVLLRLVVPFSLPVYLINDFLSSKTDYGETAEINTTADSSLTEVINENTNLQLPSQMDIPIQRYIHTDIETTEAESIAGFGQKIFFEYFKFMLPFLGWIWLTAALALLIKKLLLYYHFVRFIKSDLKPIDDEAIFKTYEDTCQLLGIKKELPLFTHWNINSPMLVGLIKPMIVLPEKQTKNASQLNYIFMHELTHYKRFDIYYKWFIQIVICIHWFNPIVYLMGKEVSRACELSCDEAVIKKLPFNEQRKYGDTLLQSLELLGGYKNPAVSLTLAENSKLIKERLKAIMDFRKKSKLVAIVSVLFTVVLCTGAAFTGIPLKNDESTALSSNKNEIKIDIPQIEPDGHKSYGPYNLKKGDVVSSNLEWFNDDGGVYFAIGMEFMNFKGFHSTTGKYGKSLKKDITVQEDGEYYIFVGNPSTHKPDVKNVAGTITINNSAKPEKQNNTDESIGRTKISVDIPYVSDIGFVESYGKYYLSKEDNVYADIVWKGEGYVMLLYTKENLNTDDIAYLIDKGILPLGGGGKFLGAGTEITSNFAYQSQNKEIVYNLTTSADEISKTMNVPSNGDYYFYVIARSNTAITDIQGDIYINKKVNTTYQTGEKLPCMNTWIGSAGEKETETGIIYNSKNFTGDRINYSFESEENGSKIIKLNSSLTGEYKIVFVTSDRTIIKTLPPFTGNREVILTELPKDTISMIIYSINVSGSLVVDIPDDVILY